MNKLKTLYTQQQSELSEHQNSLSALETKRESIQNNVIVCTEKDRSADANIQRLNKESLVNEDKKILLNNEINKLEKYSKLAGFSQDFINEGIKAIENPLICDEK